MFFFFVSVDTTSVCSPMGFYVCNRLCSYLKVGCGMQRCDLNARGFCIRGGVSRSLQDGVQRSIPFLGGTGPNWYIASIRASTGNA